MSDKNTSRGWSINKSSKTTREKRRSGVTGAIIRKETFISVHSSAFIENKEFKTSSGQENGQRQWK
jgi:hypothetical protein